MQFGVFHSSFGKHVGKYFLLGFKNAGNFGP